MNVSRRSFLKTTAVVGAGLSLGELGFNVSEVHAKTREFKLSNGKEYLSVCTFCSCGCGMLCYAKDGKLINLEGDPNHVVNEGALCSKGAAMSVIPNSDERVKKPLYRAPNSDKWVEISWEDAVDRAAKAIKKQRDAHWIAKETVDGREWNTNRCDAIGFLGGAQVNNEECYLMSKMARTLGAVFIENQTRVCHSPSVPALAAAFGRGAMTNSWNDMANTKTFLIIGSNCAENHPMSAKHIMKAKAKGAKVIHVDPRFTRTSKISDMHAQIRPGADTAFLGAIIKYIIDTNAIDDVYVNNYTNAKYILRDDFSFEDGIFSGYDPKGFKYDTTTWGYALDANGLPRVAASINDPKCVYQRIKRHYSRYTFQVAADICGIPAERIKEIADVYINNRPGAFLYALGLTQHTTGVQTIRCLSIIQLLLGNVGKPGTGINALRGEPNVQGSTDFGLIFHVYPGYINTPNHNWPTMADWSRQNGTMRTTYFVSLLKAWYGENATAANDFCYGLLPKKNGNANYTIFRIFETAHEGQMKCLYVMGQNPAVTSPNLNLVHSGMDKLETLIVADPFMTETASFWERPGADPKKIGTEVIFLPAASFLEKEGTLTNSGRFVQWRYTGIKPAGDAKSDLEIMDMVFNKLRELYKDSNHDNARLIKMAAWNYPGKSNAEFAEILLKEINGYNLQTGELLKSIGEHKPDGTTSGGNWLYAGCISESSNNTKRKDTKTDPGGLFLYPNYSWAWPGNIRLLFNRASCDPSGKPFDESRKLVWWDAAAGKWDGYDRPDVVSVTTPPASARPFRMSAEGVGRLFVAPYGEPNTARPGFPRDVSGINVDGPLPVFYEPVESPTTNVLYPKQPINPALRYPRLPNLQKIGTSKDFPIVLCTSSVTEHWCCGAYTRNVPWLNELVKETFIEIPVKLAGELNVKGGDELRVTSARGEIVAKAMVTERIQPLVINGKETYVIWIPYNWGFKGLSQAASVNLVTIDAGDPNTWIQETKACLVNVKKA